MENKDRKFSASSRRANEQVREQIANILLFDISDPRLRMVTVTSADVSPDKRNAKIYYTCSKDQYDDVEQSFHKANTYIRKLLGDRLNWRVVPALNFHLDYSIDIGEKISKALGKEQNA